MNRATSFVLYAMVARRLGTFEFGQLSLAFSLFYAFQVFAVAGQKTLIVRQVAKDWSQTRMYLVNGCTIVSLASFVSLGAVFAFLRLAHYALATNLIILLLSLGLFPYAISAVCEGIFQAWERMRYISYVNVPLNLAKMVGAYLLLSWNRGLYTVILVLVISFFAVAAIEMWVVVRRFPAQRGRIDIPLLAAMVRKGSTFMGIDGALAIENSLNVVFLSKLATEREVGLYSAATQVMVPLVLVYQSIAQSIFPVMCRKVEPGLQALRRIAEQASEGLLMMALPTVAGILFLGQWALSILYKNPAFLQAFPALRIVAWVLILQVFTYVLGQVLVATHREKITLRIVLVEVLLNLVAGLFLIGKFGLGGAAVTLLLTRMAGCIQHYIPVSRLLSGISLAKIAWKPLLAASCMAAYFLLAPAQAGILTGISATLVYVGALLALAILACGSIREFKARFFCMWSGSSSGRQEEVGP